MNGNRINYNHRLMMLRNDCGGGDTVHSTFSTYGGATKITGTSLSSSCTVASQSTVSVQTSATAAKQWTSSGGGGRAEPADDMQRNHMLEAIAVGVVTEFCFKHTLSGGTPRDLPSDFI